MLTHCSSKTKDRAVLQFMVGKITSIQIDWQPEEGLYVCSLMNVVDTDEKSWRWAGWKVGMNERKPPTEGAGKSWTTKRQKDECCNLISTKGFQVEAGLPALGQDVQFEQWEHSVRTPCSASIWGTTFTGRWFCSFMAPVKEGVHLLKSWSQNWRHWYQSADSWGLQRVNEETARRLVVI